MSRANAERAGVAGHVQFRQCTISDAVRPEGPPGLVMVNPPYGARMGDKAALEPLYRALGQVLRQRFGGWRVGMVTSESSLAQATALPFLAPAAPVPHGGLRVTLHRTAPLP
jgi:putative N6-adenine-specific DNA methylase